MEEIINGLKQIKTRVDSGTITTVNGTETLLSKQLAYMLEKAINYTRCCATLKDLKGNEIQIKSLSDLKKMYPEGTTFSVAGNGRELNYYVDGKVTYTRNL